MKRSVILLASTVSLLALSAEARADRTASTSLTYPSIVEPVLLAQAEGQPNPEEEVRRREEEAAQKAEQKRAAEEEAQKRAEQQAQKQAEEAQRQQEAAQKAEQKAEQKRAAEEEAQKRAEQQAQKQAEEAQRQQEAAQKAEQKAEQKRAAEEEAQKRAEQQAQKQAEEAQRQQEAAQKAEQQAEQKRAAEEEAQKRAEQQAQKQAEEAQHQQDAAKKAEQDRAAEEAKAPKPEEVEPKPETAVEPKAPAEGKDHGKGGHDKAGHDKKGNAEGTEGGEATPEPAKPVDETDKPQQPEGVKSKPDTAKPSEPQAPEKPVEPEGSTTPPVKEPVPEKPAPEKPEPNQPAQPEAQPKPGEEKPAEAGQKPVDERPADPNKPSRRPDRKDPDKPVERPVTDADAQSPEHNVPVEPIRNEPGRRVDQAPPPPPLPRDVTVIQNIDNRTVIKYGDNIFVENRGDKRLSRGARDVFYEDLPQGRTRETITRPDGSELVTIRNRYGDVIQRSRFLPDGREFILSYTPDNEDRSSNYYDWRDPGDDLPPLIIDVPQRDYIFDQPDASEHVIYDFLSRPPVEPLRRLYTVDEVRRSARIRNMLPRIDLDTVTFAFGSADIAENQIIKMQNIADAMLELLKRNPAETFLIEGHTDAVGSAQANLVLSDRRAEQVATALTNVFGIPPENMVTQGYGESFLKINTQAPEQQNRRVAIRRITPLIVPVAKR